MDWINRFLWEALPYIALTVLILGTILRYFFAEHTWTSKSSEFLEKRQMKYATPLFHFGLLMTFGGHVLGILIPLSVYVALGVSEKQYHMMALSGGLPAGAIILVGLLWLIWRRIAIDRLCVNTSFMDKVILVLLLCTVLSGYTATLTNMGGAFHYRESIAPWFRSLWLGDPQSQLMVHIPFIYKVHMVSWMLVAICFPFTRLVHCLSLPFEYLFRRDIIYRRR